MNSELITSLGYVRVASIAPVVSVGDVQHNVEQIQKATLDAHDQGAEIVLFPELCLTGYSCADMFRDATILASVETALEELRLWSENLSCLFVVGAPLRHKGHLYNCAVAICNGTLLASVPKTFLPNTGEFYDGRWFRSGRHVEHDTVRIGANEVPFGTQYIIADPGRRHVQIGIEICEDLWSVEPPSGRLARGGATLIVNLSASNEVVGKADYRRSLVRSQSARTYTAYAYASAGPTESTTDTVFGGHCMVAECGDLLSETSRLDLGGTMCLTDVDLARCLRERMSSTSFSQESAPENVVTINAIIPIHSKTDILRPIDPHPFVPRDGSGRSERCSEIAAIQATGLAVRIQRSGARRLILGVSGGLDSTLALLVCLRSCELLGRPPETILAVAMPGLGTTDRTHSNAELLCRELGVTYRRVDITTAVMDHFRDIDHDPSVHDVVFENAQARERTQILMDIANSNGGIVVGTGDLSEIALGWSTYNADHMSMYNPNAGVPKTLVRHMISWYAEHQAGTAATVLRDILDTPISPELLPSHGEADSSQRTEDIIGPYEVHDFFLYHFVRLREPLATIRTLAVVAFDGTYSDEQIGTWLKIFVRRFVANQFKRSCMPDGIKVGSVALSPRADWRMPSDMSAEALLRQIF
jgi:NAD+ synthase (glutamine-hydrolysing)